LHVFVAEVVAQRARAVGGAVGGGAVEDHVRGAVGHDALDARLQIGARHVLRAGEHPRRQLLGLADVDDDGALLQELLDLSRIDLVDFALHLAQQVRA